MLIEFNLHLKVARIYGTIESLKSLKAKLHANRIHRFSSVKEINDFLKNYSNEKLNILKDESKKLETEYLNTKSTLTSIVSFMVDSFFKFDSQENPKKIRDKEI